MNKKISDQADQAEQASFQEKQKGEGNPLNNNYVDYYKNFKDRESGVPGSWNKFFVNKDVSLPTPMVDGINFGQNVFNRNFRTPEMGHIVSMRQANLNQSDPVSRQIRAATARDIGKLKTSMNKRGVSGAAAASLENETRMKSDQAIADSMYQKQQRDLGMYEKLMKGLANKAGALEMGGAQALLGLDAQNINIGSGDSGK